jgi:hypothetical protein
MGRLMTTGFFALTGLAMVGWLYLLGEGLWLAATWLIS